MITPGAFTINAPAVGSNDFIQNKETGLYVEAGGKITLTKVFSQENGERDGSDVRKATQMGSIWTA